MDDVRKVPFSQRQLFYNELKKIVRERVQLEVAWPDAMIFLKANDWLKAARAAGIETADWR